MKKYMYTEYFVQVHNTYTSIGLTHHIDNTQEHSHTYTYTHACRLQANTHTRTRTRTYIRARRQTSRPTHAMEYLRMRP